MKHYSNIGNNAIQIEPILYEPPFFGPSNTDQSYYEPSASRISNSYSSTEPSENSLLSVSDAFNVPVKPNGITREEISKMYNEGTLNIKNEVKNNSKKSKLDTTLDSVNNVLNSLSTSKDATIE